MIKLKKIQLKMSASQKKIDKSKMNEILGGLWDYPDKNPLNTLPPLTERPVSTSVTMAPGVPIKHK